MWSTVLLTVIVLGLLRSIFFKRRRRIMTILQQNGISGPEPHLIKGNLSGYLSTPNVIWDTNLIQRYGPICGYYLGAKPVILVADLDLLEKIQSCAGDHFLDRPRRVPGGINPDLKRTEMLGNLKVPQWKVLRGILSKAFSPAKLQKMSGNVEGLIQVFLSCVAPSIANKEEEQYSINFYSLYQNLTLDLIGNAGFGLESDIQRNPDDCLKAAVEQEFSKSTDSFMMELYLCFPEVRWLLQPFRIQIEKLKVRMGWGGRSELWDLGLKTVVQRKIQLKTAEETESRLNSSSSSTDLLHLMLQSQKLSEIAIVANSVLFFEAGFETLSASLAFITHLLMINGEIQEQVRNEIRETLEETGGVLRGINTLLEFKYLDAVIKEGLRMYPPQTTFIGRSGDVDIMHKLEHNGNSKNLTIPKDVHIQVALWQILNSDKIWESPRTFRPQRFFDELTDSQKIAYQPFGRGKRICIGKKYAEMVLKMVFIELFSKYKVIPNEQSEVEDIEVVYKTATMTPKNGVFGGIVWDPLFPEEP